MWEILEVTSELKRLRINTLTQEYELLFMKQGGIVTDMKSAYIVQ